MATAGIYIHIPFCRSKCPYCGFISNPCGTARPPAEYLVLLKRHLRQMAQHPWCREHVFTTMFIGGGTPTSYKGSEIAALVDQCLSLFSFQEQPEVTCETNPNAVTFEDLQALKRAGVNRLSLGVQSLSDVDLQAIGRSHTRQEVLSAFGAARRAGFENINCDFMYGLPGQSVKGLYQSLEQAVRLRPQHLSLYELTLEPGTPFARDVERGVLKLPDHDTVAEMERKARELLEQEGYRRYEISNYAVPGFECRHNVNYWQNGSYLGLGASAVSCFDGLRLKNSDNFEEYMVLVEKNLPPYQEGECLSLEAAFRESVITGLRMMEGVSAVSLRERYDCDLHDYYGKTLVRFLQKDMLRFVGDRLCLTKKALPIANQVLAELV